MSETLLKILDSIRNPFIFWAGIVKNSKPEEFETRQVVAPDVDREEFTKRYTSLRRSAIVALFFLAIDLLFLVFSNSFKEFFFCALVLVLFSQFYVRYAMLMWISRKCWNSWDRRELKVKVTGVDFLRTVLRAPEEILPIKLKQVPHE